MPARHTRSKALRERVTDAFADKYPTTVSLKWVTEFREPDREMKTLESVPARPGAPAAG